MIREGMKSPHLTDSPRWRREYPLVLVMATIILWMWPAIGGRSTVFYRDLYLQYIGTARLLAGEILPDPPLLWDPLLNGGQPLLGNPNRFVLYPSRILYRFVSAVTGLNLEIVLHLLLGAIGMYLLVRRLGPGPWPAALAAYAWSLGGISISLSNHLGRFFAFHWIPWMILGVEGVIAAKRQSRWWLLLVTISSVQWLTGGFEVILATGILAVSWVLMRARAGGFYSAMSQTVLALGVAPFLMAFQLIPMAAMVLRSGRGGSLGASSILYWSLNPLRLVETVLPGVLGPIDVPELTGRYWGEHLVDNGAPYFLTLYLGVSVVFLVFAGAWGKKDRSVRWGLGTVVALSVVLALGRYNPLAHWFVETFPWLFPVRYPIKAMTLMALPVAVLAAFGLEALADQRVRDLLLRWAAVCSGLFLAVWIGLMLEPSVATRLLGSFFGGTARGMDEGVAMAFGYAGLVCLLMALALALPGERPVAPALTLLVAADLLVAATGFIPMAPRWMLESSPPVVEVVRAMGRSGRFYRTPDPVPQVLRVPADRAWGSAVANLSMLSTFLGASYGIPMVFHQDDPGLASRRYAMLNENVVRTPLKKRRPFLEMADVETIMLWGSVNLSWIEQPKVAPTMAETTYRIARTSFPHEGAWFVQGIRWVSGAGQAVEAVSRECFDPRSEVILERAPTSRLPYGPGELVGTFRAEAPNDGWLFLSIPWAPGMEISVDGHLDEPAIANVAFMAVPVKKGRHALRVVYRPPELAVGILVSLGTLVALLVAAGCAGRGSGGADGGLAEVGWEIDAAELGGLEDGVQTS